MANVVYPLRVPRELLVLADLRQKEEHLDKATALRQFMYSGAETYVLNLYSQGRISLSAAAKLLGKSVHDVLLSAEEYSCRGATTEQQELSGRTAKKLLTKLAQ